MTSGRQGTLSLNIWRFQTVQYALFIVLVLLIVGCGVKSKTPFEAKDPDENQRNDASPTSHGSTLAKECILKVGRLENVSRNLKSNKEFEFDEQKFVRDCEENPEQTVIIIDGLLALFSGQPGNISSISQELITKVEEIGNQEDESETMSLCDRAFLSTGEMVAAARGQNVPEWKGKTRARYLEICERYSPQAQKCLRFSYGLDHLDECASEKLPKEVMVELGKVFSEEFDGNLGEDGGVPPPN